MTSLRFVVLFVIGSVLCLGASKFAIGRVVPAIALKDGRTLENVMIVSVGTGSVMAKWDGGRGNLSFAILPDEAVKELSPFILTLAPPRKTPEGEYAEAMAELSNQDAKILASPQPDIPPDPRQVSGEVGHHDGSPVKVKGQIFVTSKGGENFKMGAVTVYVFGASEFMVLEKAVTKEIQPRSAYLFSMWRRASARNDFATGSSYREHILSLLNSELTLFPATQTTETDADGRFELTHTFREPYVLTARANRRVGKETESYYWVIRSDVIRKNETVLFSNNNLQE